MGLVVLAVAERRRHKYQPERRHSPLTGTIRDGIVDADLFRAGDPPAMVFHDRIRSGKDETLMTVRPSHVVGRRPFVATHLENLGVLDRLTDVMAADHETITRFGMHLLPPVGFVFNDLSRIAAIHRGKRPQSTASNQPRSSGRLTRPLLPTSGLRSGSSDLGLARLDELRVQVEMIFHHPCGRESLHKASAATITVELVDSMDGLHHLQFVMT